MSPVIRSGYLKREYLRLPADDQGRVFKIVLDPVANDRACLRGILSSKRNLRALTSTYEICITVASPINRQPFFCVFLGQIDLGIKIFNRFNKTFLSI